MIFCLPELLSAKNLQLWGDKNISYFQHKTKIKKKGGKYLLNEEINRVERGWILISTDMQINSGHAKGLWISMSRHHKACFFVAGIIILMVIPLNEISNNYEILFLLSTTSLIKLPFQMQNVINILYIKVQQFDYKFKFLKELAERGQESLQKS